MAGETLGIFKAWLLLRLEKHHNIEIIIFFNLCLVRLPCSLKKKKVNNYFFSVDVMATNNRGNLVGAFEGP